MVQVTAIRLENNGLQGVLPTELGLMTHLRELDLAENPGIMGTLPESIFSELQKLRKSYW
jgi:hypothetical protein